MSLLTPTDHDVIVGCGDHSTGFYKDLLARCVPLMQNFATSAFALNIVRSLQDQKRRIFDSKYKLLSREEAVDYVVRDLIHYSTSHKNGETRTRTPSPSSLGNSPTKRNNNTAAASTKSTADTTTKAKLISSNTSPAKTKKKLKSYAYRLVRAVCRASNFKKSTVLSSIQVLDTAPSKHVETVSERNLRLLLRQRYLAATAGAAASGLSIEAFSLQYLKQIGCDDPTTVTRPRPRPRKNVEKNRDTAVSPAAASLSPPATTNATTAQNDADNDSSVRTGIHTSLSNVSAFAEGDAARGMLERQIVMPETPMAEANIDNDSTIGTSRDLQSPGIASPAFFSENGSQGRDHTTTASSGTIVAQNNHFSSSDVSTVHEPPCSFEANSPHANVAGTVLPTSVSPTITAASHSSVNTTTTSAAVKSNEPGAVYSVRYPLGELELVTLVD